AAYGAAQVADSNPDEGLPEEPGLAEVGALRSPEVAGWSTERKVEIALAAERAARAHPKVSQVEQVVYSDVDGRRALASSRGFAGSFEASVVWAYASAFAGEGSDLMTGLGLGLGRGPDAIDPTAGASSRSCSTPGPRGTPAGPRPRARSAARTAARRRWARATWWSSPGTPRSRSSSSAPATGST